jgi:glutaminase
MQWPRVCCANSQELANMPEQQSDLGALVRGIRTAVSPFRSTLREMHDNYRALADGQVADYIPELAMADPAWFGVAVAGAPDGQLFEAGNTEQEFTIQSISKPFVFGLALEDHGREAVSARVGVEPTGDAFNSIIKLDEGSHRPHNPMVNAGAIATAALIKGDTSVQRLNRMLDMFGRYIGRRPKVDVAVFASERQTGHRNRAIGHLLLNFGMLPAHVEDVLDLYFQQCSILVTARDLAMMAATLANGGVNPVTGVRALQSEYVQDLLSVMGLVDQVYHRAQPSEAHPVEAEHQTRQVSDLRLALLFGERLAELKEAALQDVGELGVQPLEQGQRQRGVQADHEAVPDVSGRVIDAIEAANLRDRLVDVVGHLEEVEIVGRDQPRTQQVIVDVALPGLPVRGPWRVQKDDRQRP